MDRASIAVIDPPWKFKVYSPKGAKKSPKYTVEDVGDLSSLAPSVLSVLARDAMAFVLVTGPFLAQGIRLLDAWGLKYKSALIWHKHRIGTGYHSRCNAEIVLIATRGKGIGVPPHGMRRPSVFTGRPWSNEHSAKPEALQDYIDGVWPAMTKVELFARRHREGWTCIGGDLGSLITPSGIVGHPPCPRFVPGASAGPAGSSTVSTSGGQTSGP
jgi:N6-adenosine-specific RNA methylase IME4